MNNHPFYKKLKQIALGGNYSIEQVRRLRFNQAADLLGSHDFTVTFFNNMKRGVIVSLRNRDDKANMEQLKQTAKAWLDANFPNWEAERGREGDKPYVTIWLEGRP